MTETLTCQMTNNTALSLQEDIDIKQQYIEIYNQYAGSIRPELPSFHLYKNNKISSSGLSDKIVQWYLGENIIKEKKKAVQKRFTNY